MVQRVSVDEFPCCGKLNMVVVHDEKPSTLFGHKATSVQVEQPASLLVDGEWICIPCAKERGLL